MNYSRVIKEIKERKLISSDKLADILGVELFDLINMEKGLIEPSNEIKKIIEEIYDSSFIISLDNSIKTENKLIKHISINNRRYLGNKYKLLDFIKKVVTNNCSDISSFADIFSGTGAVSSAFQNLHIITNDLLYSNYIINIARFSPQPFRKSFLIDLINYYNAYDKYERNYMTDNFSGTYFNDFNCSKIGFIRESIEEKYRKALINERERAILITSLLYSMDHIANTCGHYDAYFKNNVPDKKLELCYPEVYENNNSNNCCFNLDANELASTLKADLIYLDPPYNSRQYSDAYHLLENVARWQKPPVYGTAKKMERKTLKSNYCTTKAEKSFEDLINKLNCKYILLSYNNNGDNYNDRSNAKISDAAIRKILQNKGELREFSKKYRAYTTGKSHNVNNKERLFLCICKNGFEK